MANKHKNGCVFLLALVVLCFVCFTFLALSNNSNNDYNNVSPRISAHFHKISIGAVSCRKPNETRSNDETLVMIKAIVISAKLYKVKQIDFHLFLEYLEDQTLFLSKVEDMSTGNSVSIKLHFHSALDAVPKKYHEPMIYNAKFRCTYVRLFFPTTLPDVDSILYLDTDILVTGNILELWSGLDKMSNEQLVGVVANNEQTEFPVQYKVHDCFSDVPFVPPKGLNAGLQLMNLTRMRGYGWEEKLLRLFDDYSKNVKLDDQRLLNMLLYFNPGLLYLLPCQYNIRCSPCDHGFICNDARDDYYGIQAVHGANQQFEQGGRFHYIYELYRNVWFQMAGDNIFNDLMLPIRNYSEPSDASIEMKCRRSINNLLFKNWFT